MLPPCVLIICLGRAGRNINWIHPGALRSPEIKVYGKAYTLRTCHPIANRTGRATSESARIDREGRRPTLQHRQSTINTHIHTHIHKRARAPVRKMCKLARIATGWRRRWLVRLHTREMGAASANRKQHRIITAPQILLLIIAALRTGDRTPTAVATTTAPNVNRRGVVITCALTGVD